MPLDGGGDDDGVVVVVVGGGGGVCVCLCVLCVCRYCTTPPPLHRAHNDHHCFEYSEYCCSHKFMCKLFLLTLRVF